MLKSLVRLIRSIKRNEESKPVLYHTFVALSLYIDVERTQRFKLKDLILKLISQKTIMSIMSDLCERMVTNVRYVYTAYKEEQLEISNALLFECYLTCLKYHLESVLNEDMTINDFNKIRSMFTHLENLAISQRDSNKYHFGKSLGLIELVEFLFLTKLHSNKYNDEDKTLIMSNRMRVILD